MKSTVALTTLVLAACVAGPEPATDVRSFEDVRRTVTALDDVAGEYPDAVRPGAPVDPVRLRVLDRLMHDAARYAQHLTEADRQALAAIDRAIDDHAPPATVVAAARALRRSLLASRHVTLGPAAPSSRARADYLWTTLCAGCHGEGGVGDGPQGLYLEPEPKNFQDPEFLHDLTPSRAFSRITDGMPGTAMPSWGIPTSSERWGLAVRVFSFRHDPGAVARGRALAPLAGVTSAWTALADRTDGELLAALGRRGFTADAADDVVAYVRGELSFAPVPGRLSTIRAALAGALDAVADRRWPDATGAIVAARRALRPWLVLVAARDRALAARLDEQLGRLTARSAAGAMEEVLIQETVRAQVLLDRAEPAVAGPAPLAAAGLAFERSALVVLALALALTLVPRARTVELLAAAGLGLGLGAVLPVDGWAVPGAALTLVVLAVAIRLVQRDHVRLGRMALAAAAATTTGGIGHATAALGAGPALAGAAVACVGGAVAVGACAAIGRRLRRSHRHLLADLALALAAGATAGATAWAAWTVSAHPAPLGTAPHVDALGVHPTGLALASTAAVTLAVAALALVRRPGWPPAPDRRG